MTTGESLSESQSVTNSRPYHTRKRDLVGKPDAGNPHVRFDERGTGNAAKGAENVGPERKATDKPPDPKAGAPAPDSTCAVERRVFLVGCEAHPNNCRFGW